MPLTDTQIRMVRPGEKPVRMFDGGGLYLEVAPSGGKWWRLKFRYGGKEKRLSLGVYPETPLKQARERRDDARKLLAAGTDPSAERKAGKLREKMEAEHSFEAVALAWLDHQAGAWTTETRDRIYTSLVADVFNAIGDKPIAELKARDVAAVVKAIEARGAGDTAGRVLQRIRAVFRHAVITEIIDTNPTLDLKPSELLKPRQTQHRAALPEAELPALLAKLAAYDGDPTTASALHLLMLTAVRPGELRGALWSEIDFGAAQWRIPAARMKMRAEHVVPLSTQAVEVLRRMQALSGAGALVFPSPYYPGKPLSENTLNSALARMGFKGIATAHGMRALFSTVVNEHGHDADVIERQLAHVERNKIRAAYHRAAYIAERTTLMQWWADFLDKKRAGKAVQTDERE